MIRMMRRGVAGRSRRLAAAGCFAVVLPLIGGQARGGSVTFNQFNVVTTGNLATNQDIEGTVFVGGNLSTPNGATQIPSSHSVSYPRTSYTVNVAGNINSGSTVHVEQGSVLLRGTATGTTLNFNGGGALIQDTSGTLAGERTTLSGQLTGASSAYAHLTANSSVSLPSGQPGPATFSAVAGANGVAVFDISSSFFSDSLIQQVNLVRGAGVTSIVINVSGSGSITDQLNFVGDWTDPSVRATTLWNFAGASGLNLHSDFDGAILAPLATVTNTTAIDGSVFAAALNASGEVHLPNYEGYVPTVVPEPSSLGMLGIGMVVLAYYARRRHVAPGRPACRVPSPRA